MIGLQPRIAVIEPAPDGRTFLRSILQGMDWIFYESECDNYDLGLEVIRDTRPEGVLLSLDADPQKSLALIRSIINASPRSAIIALSGSSELLLKAFRQGAKSLLEQPVKLEELTLTLKNLSTGRSLQRPPPGQVYTLLSSRGGVGCTSLAVNLGCTIALHDPNTTTVLMDLDFILGTADTALDLIPQYRISDLTDYLDRMDLQNLKAALTRHETGLYLLPRPATFQEVMLVSEDHVQRLINLLRVLANYTFIDLSKGWLATDHKAMQLADAILLVVQGELESIRNACMILNWLDGEGLKTKTRVILNRAGNDLSPDPISIPKAEEAIGKPIYWQVPNDFKAMSLAWSNGKPLVQSAPKSKIHGVIAALAADLTGNIQLDPAKTVKDTNNSSLVMPRSWLRKSS